MAKMILVVPLDRCPFGGMMGGYNCEDCGEKTRGDCRGLGSEYKRGNYPIDTKDEVDKLIGILQDYKKDL